MQGVLQVGAGEVHLLLHVLMVGCDIGVSVFPMHLTAEFVFKEVARLVGCQCEFPFQLMAVHGLGGVVADGDGAAIGEVIFCL